MMESIDDLTAPWTGNGVELACRVLAYADELDASGFSPHADIAVNLREILRCEYDPRPPVHPPLGVPPTLRPAVPPRPEVGS